MRHFKNVRSSLLDMEYPLEKYRISAHIQKFSKITAIITGTDVTIEFEKKRQVEVQCLMLQEQLESQGVSEEDIEARVSNLRKQLLENLDRMRQDAKNLQEHQVHQLAEAKEKADARAKIAFAIGDDFVAGAPFDRELQEQLEQERIQEEERREEQRKQRLEEMEKQRKKEAKKAANAAKKEQEEREKWEKELPRRAQRQRDTLNLWAPAKTYITKYFCGELGAQVKCEEKNDRYIVNGAHDAEKLQKLLDGFIDKFVLCASCKNPEIDLIITKDEFIMKNCKACGANLPADMRQKLTTYILKNPPVQPKKSKIAKNGTPEGKKNMPTPPDTAGLIVID